MNAASRNTLTLPSEAALVPETAPNPELLRSLGQLVRGLSAIFWGLPMALVVCVQTANGDWFTSLGAVPPCLATGVLLYGLILLGHFQKQERVWRYALDRARIFALVNVGLAPFLFWWNQIPGNTFYLTMVCVLAASGLLFLLTLNPVIWRLSAMLPDETLRLEAKFFTTLNRYLLLLDLLLLAGFLVLSRTDNAFWSIRMQIMAHGFFWLALLLVLVPVAMTMALVWKIKEVILSSVFGAVE
jgi:hypothetical protein